MWKYELLPGTAGMASNASKGTFSGSRVVMSQSMIHYFERVPHRRARQVGSVASVCVRTACVRVPFEWLPATVCRAQSQVCVCVFREVTHLVECWIDSGWNRGRISPALTGNASHFLLKKNTRPNNPLLAPYSVHVFCVSWDTEILFLPLNIDSFLVGYI